MNILGINAYHGNASAAIICDGRLIAAVEEERFNRVKYAAGFPAQAIRYCLKEAGLTLSDIDHIAVPRNRTRGWAQNFFTLCACRLSRANASKSSRNSRAFPQRWRWPLMPIPRNSVPSFLGSASKANASAAGMLVNFERTLRRSRAKDGMRRA